MYTIIKNKNYGIHKLKTNRRTQSKPVITSNQIKYHFHSLQYI